MSSSPSSSSSSLDRVCHCLDCGAALTGLLSLCGDCADARLLHERGLRHVAEQKARQKKWLHLCPPLYRGTDWSLPTLHPALVALAHTWLPHTAALRSSAVVCQAAARTRNRYADKVAHHSLLLSGGTGQGKTRAAFAMLHRAHQSGRSVYALHAGDAWDCGSHIQGLSSATRLQYSEDPATAQSALQCLRRARSSALLLLDDVGKERATHAQGTLSEAVGEALFALIEHRLVHQLPMILTTNAHAQALETRLGPDRGVPLMRRLMEACKVVEV